MQIIKRYTAFFIFAVAFIVPLCLTVNGQANRNYEVLAESALAKVVPTSFYFAGQSAETQMRNAAAARIGKERHIIAGLVDTSGYSTEISGKYEGFFITDSPVMIGTKTLGTGAYGFGFSRSGFLNIFDLSSKLILSVESKNDNEIKRPRPLQMMLGDKGIRLYKGKSYILLKPR